MRNDNKLKKRKNKEYLKNLLINHRNLYSQFKRFEYQYFDGNKRITYLNTTWDSLIFSSGKR